jgi:hypothetical protein
MRFFGANSPFCLAVVALCAAVAAGCRDKAKQLDDNAGNTQGGTASDTETETETGGDTSTDADGDVTATSRVAITSLDDGAFVSADDDSATFAVTGSCAPAGATVTIAVDCEPAPQGIDDVCNSGRVRPPRLDASSRRYAVAVARSGRRRKLRELRDVRARAGRRDVRRRSRGRSGRYGGRFRHSSSSSPASDSSASRNPPGFTSTETGKRGSHHAL